MTPVGAPKSKLPVFATGLAMCVCGTFPFLKYQPPRAHEREDQDFVRFDAPTFSEESGGMGVVYRKFATGVIAVIGLGTTGAAIAYLWLRDRCDESAN